MGENRIRFGGQEIDGRFMFELTGGAPALDFVNTLDERRGTPKERLNRYAVLVDWSTQAGLLSSADGKPLLVFARRNPVRTAAILEAAIKLREVLFEVTRALAAGQSPSGSALQDLNTWIAKASRRRRLIRSGAGLTWAWGELSIEPDVMLWRVVESAAAIFVSDDLRARLRICGGPTCAWTFLDFSPKKNRRWCDMSVCGNRAKARRHYKRSRVAAAAKGRSADRGPVRLNFAARELVMRPKID